VDDALIEAAGEAAVTIARGRTGCHAQAIELRRRMWGEITWHRKLIGKNCSLLGIFGGGLSEVLEGKIEVAAKDI